MLSEKKMAAKQGSIFSFKTQRHPDREQILESSGKTGFSTNS